MTTPTIATAPTTHTTHTTAATLTIEEAEQQIRDATLSIDAAKAAYAAAVARADGHEMWRLRQAKAERDELRAAAIIEKQRAVIRELEAKVSQAQKAAVEALTAAEQAAASNLAAKGLDMGLRTEAHRTALQSSNMERDVTAAQAQTQAAERALSALVAETARRIG